MIVSDFILSIRRRLDDTKNNRWPQEALVEFINEALTALCRDLLVFKMSATYIATDGQTFWRMPKNKLNTISVSINGKTAIVKSMEYVAIYAPQTPQNSYIVYETLDGITLNTPLKKGDTIVISYNYTVRVETDNDELPIPEYMNTAVRWYVLHLCDQKGIPDDPLINSKTYYANYTAEVSNVRAMLHKTFSSKQVTSTFQKV